MRTLESLFEGILSNDFDVELTYGDVYEFTPDFGVRPPSEFKGYAWDATGFWKQYEGIQNAWTRRVGRFSESRQKFLRSDIRHGFVMFILTQPINAPMHQKAVDDYVRQMDEWCDTSKLKLLVNVRRTRDGFQFTMWNQQILDSTKSFMGKFEICKRPNESLLDADFDIKDEDLSINNVHPINHKMWQVIPAMSDRIYQNATKAFFEKMPKTPEHIVNSSFGTRNMIRYFIDWIAVQPIGAINDDQFAANKPTLVTEFEKWIDNKKFTLTMAKMGNTKYVYFNYNKVKMLRIKFE